MKIVSDISDCRSPAIFRDCRGFRHDSSNDAEFLRLLRGPAAQQSDSQQERFSANDYERGSARVSLFHLSSCPLADGSFARHLHYRRPPERLHGFDGVVPHPAATTPKPRWRTRRTEPRGNWIVPSMNTGIKAPYAEHRLVGIHPRQDLVHALRIVATVLQVTQEVGFLDL